MDTLHNAAPLKKIPSTLLNPCIQSIELSNLRHEALIKRIAPKIGWLLNASKCIYFSGNRTIFTQIPHCFLILLLLCFINLRCLYLWKKNWVLGQDEASKTSRSYT